MILEDTSHYGCISATVKPFSVTVWVRNEATSEISEPMVCGWSPLLLILSHAGTDQSRRKRKQWQSIPFQFERIYALQLISQERSGGRGLIAVEDGEELTKASLAKYETESNERMEQ